MSYKYIKTEPCSLYVWFNFGLQQNHRIIRKKSKRIGLILLFKRISSFPKRLIFLKKPAKHWHSLWIAFVEIGKNWFYSRFTERSDFNQSFSLRQIVYEYQLRTRLLVGQYWSETEIWQIYDSVKLKKLVNASSTVWDQYRKRPNFARRLEFRPLWTVLG